MIPVTDRIALDESLITESFIRASGPVDNLPGAFVRPAIIDVTGLNVLDEEMFAPFLQVIRVPTFDAAIQAANGLEGPADAPLEPGLVVVVPGSAG